MHDERHPLAGQQIKIKFKEPGHFQIEGLEHEAIIEDWWDRFTGGSWMFADGNPAALVYAMRSAIAELPLNDEVVYAKINGLGHIIHETELIKQEVPVE